MAITDKQMMVHSHDRKPLSRNGDASANRQHVGGPRRHRPGKKNLNHKEYALCGPVDRKFQNKETRPGLRRSDRGGPRGVAWGGAGERSW